MRPTPAQINTLRLAYHEAIRYYRGGWYSIPSVLGEDQADHPRLAGAHGPALRREANYANAGTLRACVARGWLDAVTLPSPPRRSVYDARWTITEAGRAALVDTTGAIP